MIRLMFAMVFLLGLPVSAFCEGLVDSGEQFLGITQASLSWGDYDRDGDIDLAVCGLDKTGQPVTKIYKNEPGTTTFQEDISQKITGVSYGKVGWNDYNGDGRLDLSVAGYNADRQPVSKVYQNVDGILIEDTTQHPPIRYGSIAWTDSNKDAEKDSYCMAGCDETTDWKPYTKIYRKTKEGEFVEDPQTLISTYYGSLAWGDYDGDGDLDLIIGGWLPDGAAIKAYINDNGRFVEDTRQKLIPVFHSSMAFGDYDGDGSLDLIVAGQTMAGSRTTTLYKNEAGTLTVDTTQNLPGVIFGCANWIDYDNDEDLDLALAGEDTTGVPILKLYNNEQALSTPIQQITIAAISHQEGSITLTTDTILSLEAKGYDEAGNFVRNVSVQWEIQGDIGVLSGKRAPMVTFDPRKPGTGSIQARDGKGHIAQLDNIIVTPGMLHHLAVTGMDNNPIHHVSLVAGDILSLSAAGYDADNNPLGQIQANWEINGDIGTMSSPGIGTQATFTAVKVGTGTIVVTDANGHHGCTGIIAVNSGALSYLEIAPIQTQVVEEMFDVQILACDALSNHILDQFGPVTLLDSAGVMGSVTLMFEKGIAIGSVSIPVAISETSLLAQTNDKKGKSNSFSVIGGQVSGGMYKDVEETQKISMAGVPIKAYKVLDNNELVLKGTTSTGPDGDYAIDGLPRGTYTVAILPPANYQPMMATKIAKVSTTPGFKGAPPLASKLLGVNFVLIPLYLDLNAMVVYPNPLSLAEGQTGFTFGSLPAHSICVKIYNIAGELVYEKSTNEKPLIWGAVNNDGTRVASGIYLFLIEDETTGQQRRGKIAVVR
ncbi:MAG: FG-GAP-like repeat-containing protein [Candidatus Desantisbacteria bacterium]